MVKKKRKLNILILTWRAIKHSQAGGAEIATHEHAKAWVKYGHRVTIFTSKQRHLPRYSIIDGVKYIRYGNSFPGVHISAFIWYILFGSKKKYNLIIDEFHGIPFFTPFYAKATIIAYIHEVAREVWKYNPWPSPFNYIPMFIGPLVEPIIFKIYKNKHFMTVSNSTKNDLKLYKIPSRNIHIIPNGVSQELSSIKKKKENIITLIYLGFLSADKGVEDALRVLIYLSRIKNIKLQLWIVGRGDKGYIKRLYTICKKNRLNNVTFYGYVSEKKKFELLARSHILINPSRYEGWGLVNIEANIVGVPVVGYSVPGMVDSVKHNHTGILVEDRNIKQLSNAILLLIQNKLLYNRLKKNAYKWGKKFTWEISTKKSINLINLLCCQ